MIRFAPLALVVLALPGYATAQGPFESLLADVPPTSHPLAVVNSWAEDVPHESLLLDEVFANAPAREGDLFRVPPTG